MAACCRCWGERRKGGSGGEADGGEACWACVVVGVWKKSVCRGVRGGARRADALR